MAVFKTAALNHSATPPSRFFRLRFPSFQAVADPPQLLIFMKADKTGATRPLCDPTKKLNYGQLYQKAGL
jgi:hypothetical protein